MVESEYKIEKVNWAEKMKPIVHKHDLDWKKLLKDQAKTQYKQE